MLEAAASFWRWKRGPVVATGPLFVLFEALSSLCGRKLRVTGSVGTVSCQRCWPRADARELQAVHGLVYGGVAGEDFEGLAVGVGGGEGGEENAGGVLAGDLAATAQGGGGVHAPGLGFVGEAAGADDGVIEAALA